jgi:alpha,alpha-trehalose phosphorylase (configuration-retaining)
VAMPIELSERCPALCSRLWKELDIVPVVLHESENSSRDSNETPWKAKSVDELAESMAQKCIRFVT